MIRLRATIKQNEWKGCWGNVSYGILVWRQIGKPKRLLINSSEYSKYDMNGMVGQWPDLYYSCFAWINKSCAISGKQ